MLCRKLGMTQNWARQAPQGCGTVSRAAPIKALVCVLSPPINRATKGCQLSGQRGGLPACLPSTPCTEPSTPVPSVSRRVLCCVAFARVCLPAPPPPPRRTSSAASPTSWRASTASWRAARRWTPSTMRCAASLARSAASRSGRWLASRASRQGVCVCRLVGSRRQWCWGAGLGFLRRA